MPIHAYWKYVCPITGVEEISDNGDAPPGWFVFEHEHYSLAGNQIIAARMLRGVTDKDLLVAKQSTVPGDDGYVEPEESASG